MSATGTPEEQVSNSSAASSTNSGGASAKQILEVRGRKGNVDISLLLYRTIGAKRIMVL